MREHAHNPWLHRIALLTAAATFPLIFMGGRVTSRGAGMSVPDWPNTYGYNMFLFPPSKWVGGIFYEHTHRLMGTVVGMLAIALVIVAWKTEPRRWVRRLTWVILIAVIFQGVLGGVRVLKVDLNMAIVHACFAQAFFCIAGLAAIVTSRWWKAAPDLSEHPGAPAGRRLIGLAAVCVFAIFAQLVIGAVMRHNNAGLAIPDLPLAYGKLLPPTDQNALKQVNLSRAWEAGLEPVTLTQVWLHFGHRIGAVIVSLLSAALVVLAVRRHRSLGMLAVSLAVLVIVQVALGVFTVLYRKPADVASAHVAFGALVLVTTFVILVRAARLYVRRPAVADGIPAMADLKRA